MLQVILAVAGVYSLMLLSLFVFQRNLMYHTDSPPVPVQQSLVPHAEERFVESGPGIRVRSWYLPPAGDKPVIVLFHGNAGTIADRDFKAAPWHDAGYGVWLSGYRGFGGNAGSPTEQGLYDDARAVIGALSKDGIAPGRIVLYGESLGSGIATQMAFELARAGTPAKALVLEAPFSSMGAAAQDRYFYVPARMLVRDKYENIAKIAAIDAPLFIMHGDDDRVITQSHGRALYAAAKEPKRALWIDGGGHTGLFDHGAGQAVIDFIEGLD
ncbi:MAG: alpha/beta hydrolase [Rhodospirillales bacterium]|nr:alpha/beta hydrolase [Rhodospirillales bacterium]MBO6786916.1 alpha/beta hydrolase [Rhodospirillales bacterium]